MARVRPVFFSLFLLISLKAASQLHLSPFSDTIHIRPSLRVLPQNFYIQHLGFFCKKEVQLQKATSLPFYIRLGSKDYVDRREGKSKTCY
jgi:hypothetical protein